MKAPKSLKPCNSWMRSVLIGSALVGSLAVLGAQGRSVVRMQNNSSNSGEAGQTSAQASALHERVVRFCRAHVGKQVGNGQCAVLIVEALRAAGAVTRFTEAPGSGDYVWGVFVCKLEAKNGTQTLEVGEAGQSKDKRRRTDVRPGDIIQFRDAEFQGTEIRPEGRYTYHASRLHHTAVVSQVNENSASCKVFEQNYNGKLTVVESTLRLPEMTHGWLRVYRPIEKIEKIEKN